MLSLSQALDMHCPRGACPLPQCLTILSSFFLKLAGDPAARPTCLEVIAALSAIEATVREEIRSERAAAQAAHGGPGSGRGSSFTPRNSGPLRTVSATSAQLQQARHSAGHVHVPGMHGAAGVAGSAGHAHSHHPASQGVARLAAAAIMNNAAAVAAAAAAQGPKPRSAASMGQQSVAAHGGASIVGLPPVATGGTSNSSPNLNLDDSPRKSYPGNSRLNSATPSRMGPAAGAGNTSTSTSQQAAVVGAPAQR